MSPRVPRPALNPNSDIETLSPNLSTTSIACIPLFSSVLFIASAPFIKTKFAKSSLVLPNLCQTHSVWSVIGTANTHTDQFSYAENSCLNSGGATRMISSESWKKPLTMLGANSLRMLRTRVVKSCATSACWDCISKSPLKAASGPMDSALPLFRSNCRRCGLHSVLRWQSVAPRFNTVRFA